MIGLTKNKFNSSKFLKAVATVAITFGSLFAADNFPASTTPPGGLSVSETPQFIVTGWDDNAAADGVAWVRSLFEGRKNPEGKGNPRLFDGQDIGTSFYCVTNTWAGSPQLVTEIKKMVDSPHLIENHTKDHMNEIFAGVNWVWGTFLDSIPKVPYENWHDNYVGVAKSDIVKHMGVDGTYHLKTGFRHPFLVYSKNSLQAVKDQGYLYDCSAWAWTSPDGKNIEWPYTLDNGVSWDKNTEEFVPGLWEVPVYSAQYPTDDKCEEYGIPVGFIERQGKTAAGGMDYSLFVQEKLTGPEVLAVLKHNLDLRRNGDRAPLTFGGHSGYYGASSDHTGIESLENMRKTWVDFLDYAQSFDEVRIVTATQLIEWMRKPVGLNSTNNVVSTMLNPTKEFALSIKSQNALSLTVPQKGKYSLSVYTSNGKMLKSVTFPALHKGVNKVELDANLSQNFYLFKISGASETAILKGFVNN